MNNYFENIDLTKIEVIWFAFPVLYIPVLFIPSPSYYNIIYASAITFFVLGFTVFLSTRGYTSYTPWLEKLANEKESNDKAILKLMNHENNYEKCKEIFYYRREREEDEPEKKDLTKSNFFGKIPPDPEEKWYEVFTQEFDYQMYKIIFEVVYGYWIKEDKTPFNEEELEVERDKRMVNNPELIPTKKDDVVRKAMKDEFAKPNCGRLEPLIEIFRDYNTHKNEIQNHLVKKAIFDIEYFAIMVNFRRGLEDLTKYWLKTIEQFEDEEKKRFEGASSKGVFKGKATRDLQNDFKDKLSTITDLSKIIPKKPQSQTGTSKPLADDENTKKSEDSKAQEPEIFLEIKKKLSNRNNWDSEEWRALGSIYYRWRDSAKKEIDPLTGKSRSNNDTEKKNFEDFEPIVEAKKNRTVEAVNDLKEKFGSKESGEVGKAIIFFGVVFGLVAAVALTNSIDTLIAVLYDEDTGIFIPKNFTENIFMIFLFMSFLPLAILYYHGGTIFLSAEASQEVTSGNKGLVLINFLIILSQAIILYFLAASIADVNTFLWLIITLAVLDGMWVLIFTWNDMKDAVKDAPIFLEWIIFDMAVLIFALIFMANYTYADSCTVEGTCTENFKSNWVIFGLLFSVLTVRTVVDYKYAWKNFWSLFGDAE